MIYLVITTFIWAFSFSLIGHFLAGKVDPYLSIFLRFSVAFFTIALIPKRPIIKNSIKFKLMMIGSIQVGLMYVFFYQSFEYLAADEVALLTIFTPIYIMIFSSLKKIHSLFKYLLVLMCVVGAFIIKYKVQMTPNITGLILVQMANICFSIGQLSYKYLLTKYKLEASPGHFLWFYLGAIIISVFTLYRFSNLNKIPQGLEQYLVLIWLGVVASGLGYYFWNKGAKMVSDPTLALMNNLVIPIAIFIECIIWKQFDFNLNFYLGTLIILLTILANSMKKACKDKILL